MSRVEQVVTQESPAPISLWYLEVEQVVLLGTTEVIRHQVMVDLVVVPQGEVHQQV
jgi:hypothetical protein